MTAGAPRVAVFGEIYSPNLGDGVIYDCVSHIFAKHGVTTVPVDLSGRGGWLVAGASLEPGLLRWLARKPILRNRYLRRIVSAFIWYAIKRKKISPLWAAAIVSSDAVVIGGGHLLTDGYFGFVPRIFEIARLAKLYRKPLAIFGCGSDPEWGYLASKLYSKVVRQAVFVSARDEVSAALLSKYVSRDVSVDIHPDPAFIVNKVYSGSILTSSENVLGLSLQSANYFREDWGTDSNLSDQEYQQFWVKLVIGALGDGKRVKFLSNGDVDDYAETAKIVQLLKEKAIDVAVEPRPQRPRELVENISGISEFICTRMHAGIIAYSIGRTVLPISWNAKVDAVWGGVDSELDIFAGNEIKSPEPWADMSTRLMTAKKSSHDLDQVTTKLDEAVGRCLTALSVASGDVSISQRIKCVRG